MNAFLEGLNLNQLKGFLVGKEILIDSEYLNFLVDNQINDCSRIWANTILIILLKEKQNILKINHVKPDLDFGS